MLLKKFLFPFFYNHIKKKPCGFFFIIFEFLLYNRIGYIQFVCHFSLSFLQDSENILDILFLQVYPMKQIRIQDNDHIHRINDSSSIFSRLHALDDNEGMLHQFLLQLLQYDDNQGNYYKHRIIQNVLT